MIQTSPTIDGNSRTGETPIAAPVIRTPDQRVRVFVSSTLDELAPERGAAREAIAQLHLTPVLFESGARPYPPRELYQAYLTQSDIFLGLYWQRYGWVAPSMAVSGLEEEYQLSTGKPRLIYVKTPAPEREPGLQRLLDRIRADGDASYQHFTTQEELRERIANDLALLLTERFAQANPGFALTADNAAAIVELCRRLDGLPLALELSAARLSLLTPQALLTRMKHRLPVLTRGARDLPQRQQTLRNTLAWSYDLLQEREQHLFRQLAVFVGSFPLEAVKRRHA